MMHKNSDIMVDLCDNYLVMRAMREIYDKAIEFRDALPEPIPPSFEVFYSKYFKYCSDQAKIRLSQIKQGREVDPDDVNKMTLEIRMGDGWVPFALIPPVDFWNLTRKGEDLAATVKRLQSQDTKEKT